MIADGFKWLNDDSVVIQRVDAVAVYINERNEVVIRQENQVGDGDAIIVIPVRCVPDLMEALQNVIT